jgi:hypothetical protein
MKKFLLFLFTGIGVSFNTFAQVPDFAFEFPWNNIASNPQGWASAKILYPNVVVRDTVVRHFGVASAKITTTDVSLIAGQTNGLLPASSGILLTGIIAIGGNPPIKLGYPFSQRKDSLGFFARYQPVGADTAFAQVIFYKRNTQRDTIAIGETKILSTNGNFNLNYVVMNYLPAFPSSTLPDSALIIFSSSSRTSPQLGSNLWVDDLQWGTINTGISESTLTNNKISLTPNPANEFVTVNLGDGNNASQIEVIDVNGKVIERFAANSKTETINVRHLSDGMYFYTVRDKYAFILATGKFNIKH